MGLDEKGQEELGENTEIKDTKSSGVIYRIMQFSTRIEELDGKIKSMKKELAELIKEENLEMEAKQAIENDIKELEEERKDTAEKLGEIFR